MLGTAGEVAEALSAAGALLLATELLPAGVLARRFAATRFRLAARVSGTPAESLR